MSACQAAADCPNPSKMPRKRAFLNDDPLLDVSQAASWLGVHASTLNRWRYNDGLVAGLDKPHHLKVGGRVFYRMSYLKGFLAVAAKRAVENEFVSD